MVIAWSYGGGVQSVAIGVLIREGALPKPDLAVIADTGRERRTTWEYLHQHMQPYLDPVGVRIEIAGHELAHKDLYGPTGLTLMPMFLPEGRLPAYCSGNWKRDVIERWLRQQEVKECDCWIGYSIDEIRRVPKTDHRPWCRAAFPLIDKFINRAMCARLIEAAGLPVPRKSRCWQCPHQTAEEWLEVRADLEEWAAAVALEKEINANDPALEKGEMFLSCARKPLELVDFAADVIVPPRVPCEGGHCWT